MIFRCIHICRDGIFIFLRSLMIFHMIAIFSLWEQLIVFSRSFYHLLSLNYIFLVFLLYCALIFIFLSIKSYSKVNSFRIMDFNCIFLVIIFHNLLISATWKMWEVLYPLFYALEILFNVNIFYLKLNVYENLVWEVSCK